MNLIETCMQMCFGWMALNVALIVRFYNFLSIFHVTICLIRWVRKVLDNGKGEVRLRPELKGLVSCSILLTREMSPGRSHVTTGSPACSAILLLNALCAAGQQINIGKGARVKAMHGQCRRGAQAAKEQEPGFTHKPRPLHVWGLAGRTCCKTVWAHSKIVNVRSEICIFLQPNSYSVCIQKQQRQ